MDPLIGISLIQTGQPAPSFSLLALDGGLYRLEEGRGRILVLSFWSAECPWAERSDQELSAYLPAWGQRVALWTIASNAHESPELMIQTFRQRTATRFYLRDAVNALLSGASPDPAQTAPYGCAILRHVD